MGKVYKGWELYKMIITGEIEKDSKFMDNNSQIWTWNGFGFIPEERDYNDYVFSAMDFELLKDEEIDIQEIEELEFTEECVKEPSESGVGRLKYKSVSQNEMQHKINEIIRTVNKMLLDKNN